MNYQNRKRNRLSGYDYSRHGAYFVTICTWDKQPLLSRITYESTGIYSHTYEENPKRWLVKHMPVFDDDLNGNQL